MNESTTLLLILAGTPPAMAVLAGLSFQIGRIGIGLALIGGALVMALAPLAILAA